MYRNKNGFKARRFLTIEVNCFRFASGKSDKEILDNLLKNSRYDKRLRPPVEGKCNLLSINITHGSYSRLNRSYKYWYNIADPDFCCGLKTPNDTVASPAGLPSLRPRAHNRGALCSMFMKREILSTCLVLYGPSCLFYSNLCTGQVFTYVIHPFTQL